MENVEAQTTVEKDQATPQPNPQNVLFGTISYEDDSAYENFIQGMSVNHAVFVLIAAANFAQAKGSFNLMESEALSSAIRSIKKTGNQGQAPAEGTDSAQ